jgi:hypothetical protein
MMAAIALRAARGKWPAACGQGNGIAILPLRVANYRTVDSEAVARAIDYASSGQGRVVVNLSLAPVFHDAPGSVVDSIIRNPQVLFVLAAGNRGDVSRRNARESLSNTLAKSRLYGGV